MESNMTEMIENLSDRKVLLHHICAETEDALVKLDTIWDRMGIDTDLREERAKVVLKHVKTLYKEMLAEAEDQQTKLINSIESLIQKLNALSKEMQTQISFDGYEETPLTTVKHELYQKLKKYDLMYQARKTEITDIMDEEQVLCLVLGREPKSLQISPLPKPEEVVEFRKHVDDLSQEKDRRQELFLKTKSEILEIIRELKIKPNLDFENKILTEKETEFVLSDENMSKLAEYHKRLVIQLTETSKEITKLRETLTTLWKLLEECPEKQTNFLKSHVGTNMETLKAMKKEIARLEEKKRANIKIFIDKIREEIVNWWTLCRYSCAQRAEFKHFETNIYTEDLLSLHELYLEKLKNFYESNKAIFGLITKREQLWEKMLELERCANEPDRYKNRGGQLLREEKERKKVASRLPKIEQELLGLVDEYEGKVGERFLVNGEVVSDLIANMWASHREDKHLKLSAKKQAREQPTLTPMKSPMPLVQSRLTPAATPSKRKIALTLFGSGKRSKQTANVPKIQVNGSTIKRASMERKRKMEKRRKSKIQQNLNDSTTSSTTDYNDFEKAIAAKPACRSTLFSMGAKKTINTPRTPRQTNRTPSVNTPRPPSRNQLRPTTPAASTSQFSAVPGNLPIII